jgi:hypothetical protein
MTSPSSSKVSIYYSSVEGWIHVLIFNGVNENGDTDISSARSEVMPYSDAQLAYFVARANADPNIYVFKADRLTTNSINTSI